MEDISINIRLDVDKKENIRINWKHVYSGPSGWTMMDDNEIYFDWAYTYISYIQAYIYIYNISMKRNHSEMEAQQISNKSCRLKD